MIVFRSPKDNRLRAAPGGQDKKKMKRKQNIIRIKGIVLTGLVAAALALTACGGAAGGEAAVSDSAAETEEAAAEEPGVNACGLEDGTYIANFETDSTMFHINEADEGTGILTVEDGEMSIHIRLPSKNIVNVYPGLKEDASKEGAELIQPTTDEVTYSDGMTGEVYGFDIPVPAIDEEFNVAIIGTHGNWYDHKVKVTDPRRN